MATNLAGATCIGQHSVCLMRAAKLRADCYPQGGIDGGIITVGIVTATATPEYTDVRRVEPLNGCGRTMYTFEQAGQLLRMTLSGEIVFHDWEMMKLLFGGSLIIGRAGSTFAGKVIGWARPSNTDPEPDDVYLEFIVKNASQDSGECASAGAAFPTYTGHVFGKASLTMGAMTYNDQAITLPFEGTATKNPNLVLGPWSDYPGTGAMPNTPHFEVGYSEAQFTQLLGWARCGYQTLPNFYSG